MIEKNTLDFLKKLARNNNREWFQENKTLYEKARKNVLDATLYLLSGISEFDTSVQYVNPEDCLFRIYRDQRFSPNKNPYKTNMGLFIRKGGRKMQGAGYYLHIEPGNSFVSGGMYMPDPSLLFAVRSTIAKNHITFKRIISAPAFKKLYGELCDDTLKTAPKGFPKDHPAVEFLRHKHFYVMSSVEDRELLGKDFLKQCVKAFKVASPFVLFLNEATV